MNELKIEVLFELATVQKNAGADDDSKDNYKLVYDADPSYENIEEIINNL